jgi:uncharacterized protein (DUF58 family)
VAASYRYLPPHLADRLDGLAVTLRRPLPGGHQGMHRSRHHGSSVEFADYRAYAPGDPPSRIDWAVYARSDRYLLRRTEDETRLRTHLLLDISESMSYRRSGAPSKLEQACAMAAALAYVLVRQGDAVQLHPLAAAQLAGPPPAAGLDGLRPLLLALEGLTASGGGDAAQAMHRFAEQQRPRGLVVVLSDLLCPAAEILAAVAHLTHAGHQVALLQILDRDELALPFSGVVEIAELETGRRAVVEVDRMREAYAEQVRLHLDTLRRGAAASAGSHHLVECGAAIDRALRDVLASL